MDIFEAVTLQLAALGYTATEADSAAIDYNIKKAENSLKVNTNQREVPEGLFYVWADMAAGLFMQDKIATGILSNSADNGTDAPVKSITEGDVTVTYAVDSDSSSAASLSSKLERMVNLDESLIAAFRRFVW